MKQNQPSAAAIRAAKKWRDLDLNGPISQPGSPTKRLAMIIDSEFSEVVAALRELVADVSECDPGCYPRQMSRARRALKALKE